MTDTILSFLLDNSDWIVERMWIVGLGVLIGRWV